MAATGTAATTELAAVHLPTGTGSAFHGGMDRPMRTPRPGAALRRATDRLVANLRRTISAEKPLLAHPLYGYGAAHVVVEARSELRRIERRGTGW